MQGPHVHAAGRGGAVRGGRSSVSKENRGNVHVGERGSTKNRRSLGDILETVEVARVDSGAPRRVSNVPGPYSGTDAHEQSCHPSSPEK